MAAQRAKRPAGFGGEIVLKSQFFVASDHGRDFGLAPVVPERFDAGRPAGAGGKSPAHRSVETQAAGADHFHVVGTRGGQHRRVAEDAYPTEIGHEEIAGLVGAPLMHRIVVDPPLVAQRQGIVLAAARHQVPAKVRGAVADQEHVAPRMPQDAGRHLVAEIEL